MFGLFFGTACLVGFAIVAARGRHHHPHGRWGGRRFWLRRAFARLDTTPGQEKVILTAVDELRDRMRAAREGLPETRRKVAEVLRESQLDPDRVASLLDEPLARADGLRSDVARAIATIHEVLTPKQREALSALVAAGPPFGRHHAHAC